MTRPFTLILLACPILLASAAGAAPLRFAWSAPGRAVVTETSVKGGSQTKTSWDLVVSRAKDAKDRLRAHVDAVKVLEARDAQGNDLLQRPAAPSLRALSSVRPDLVIDTKGGFVDIANLEEARTAALDGIANEQAREAAKALMSAPAAAAGAKARAAEEWSLWVGFWLANAPAEPGTRDVTLPITRRDGAKAGLPAKITRRAAGPDRPKLEVLERDDTLDGELALELLAPIAQGLAAQGGSETKRLIDREHVERLDRVTHWELVTDPRTLRPVSASARITVTLKLRGGTERSQVETHEYAFAWK